MGQPRRCLQTLSWYSQRSEGGGVLGPSAPTLRHPAVVWWSVHRPERFRSPHGRIPGARRCPNGSGRQGRVELRRQRPLLGLELEGERRPTDPRPSFALFLGDAPGRGLLLAAWQRGGPGAGAATTRSDYVHGSSCGSQWQRPVGSCWLRIQTIAFSPTLGGCGCLFRWLASNRQAWKDSVREGRPMLPGLARGLAAGQSWLCIAPAGC